MGILLLRKSKGLSGREVAKMMNIHPSYYSHLETGRRKFTPELIQELARVLDEPLDIIKNKVNQIDDQGSWVLGIKIHGQNIVKAFENELLLDRPKDIKKEIKERFAKFIERNIAQSVMTEIDNDSKLQNALITKYKYLEEKT